ncbi:HEPN domain-containing protein [Dyadobacter chenhuakuii]|uniref:HEPN domain-containing protein n=1 Tax=Dyadobacter chenhuakuii TaxID=2909339 RepID=A0ABY4XEN7_9BACT|nr:HEPN domain-containing protein [Dyadobacter chenhuakuii]USJ28881.2 HEPN domain-containing protein [Dyadobacter chenhuakuii]
MKHIAFERLSDAEILFRAKRFDSAVYLCGYCMEIYLKHKICQTLNWPGFPSTGKDFEKFKSLKTHDLGVLLSLSGAENFVLKEHLLSWSPLLEWNPEFRYRVVGTVREEEAEEMIESVKTMIQIL